MKLRRRHLSYVPGSLRGANRKNPNPIVDPAAMNNGSDSNAILVVLFPSELAFFVI